MTHPLTDDICKSIAVCYPYNNRIDIEDCGHLTDMRAAADWQLEQVIEQWEELFNSTNMTDTQVIREFHTRLIEMRPQENN